MKEWLQIGERLAQLPSTSPRDRQLIKAHISLEIVQGSGFIESGTQDFGQFLRDSRVAAGLSLRDTASRMGISASYLSKLENGLALNPKPRIVEQARTFFGYQGVNSIEAGPGDGIIGAGINVIAVGHQLNREGSSPQIGRNLTDAGVVLVQTGTNLMQPKNG